MKDFHEHLAKVVHVSEKHGPYYAGWVQQAYRVAGRPLREPLPVEAEEQALAKLKQHREEWQIKQARHALRLYRYFISSQRTPEKPQPAEADREAWRGAAEKACRVVSRCIARAQVPSDGEELSHVAPSSCSLLTGEAGSIVAGSV